MEFLTALYFGYTFVALYFLCLLLLIYFQNRHQMETWIAPKRVYPLSIVVPCFNAEKTIAKTLDALLASEYRGLKRIIAVDDCSKDSTFAILKAYEKKYPSMIKAVQTPKNTGRAAGAKNYGAQFVTTELIGFTDDDSRPQPDAMEKMVGFFNDEEVGAVTSRVLVQNRDKSFLTKSQAIEYKVIAFERKLLEFIDSIYVTNGPLSIYRLKGFRAVRGFNFNNWTEDIEITWHLVSKGWKVRMAMMAKVYTNVPEKVKAWFRQRIRWNVGGIQTVAAYKKKYASVGMLGFFIMPFFTLAWIVGITGLFFMMYRIYTYLLSKYLIAQQSVAAEVALITFREFKLNPDLLFYFGAFLFTLGIIFTFRAILYSKEERVKHRLLDIFIYSIFYLLMYPPILVYSFYKFWRGLDTW